MHATLYIAVWTAVTHVANIRTDGLEKPLAIVARNRSRHLQANSDMLGAQMQVSGKMPAAAAVNLY